MNSKNNTFRFKSFGERVNEIDIRRAALYHIGHENEEFPENDETYFHQTLKKWSVLNLTEEFNDFQRKCSNIVTLPQLIHKKDFIIDFLLEKLSTATTLSLQPLLECIVVLGKDLREEFYSYFQRILDRLTCLLNTKDADQLEWTLICLAFLFKTLKPFLKKNITIVFNSILPLLDERQYTEQVINFAVECFSFIARDIREHEKLLTMILKNIESESIYGAAAGCGRLFFEIIRGVNGKFHSVASSFLSFLFESLLNPKLDQKLLAEIVEITNENLLLFIHPQNMSLYWLAINKSIENYFHNSNNGIDIFLDLICTSVKYKNGKYLTELDVLVPNILKLLESLESESSLEKCTTLIASVLLSTAKVSQLDTTRLFKKVLRISNRKIFENFIWQVAEHPQFEILILPDFLKYFEQNFDENTLELLAKLCLNKSPLSRDGQNFNEWKKYQISFKKPQTFVKFSEIFNNLKEDNYEEFLLAAIILPHTNFEDLSQIVRQMREICEKLIKELENINLKKEINKKLFSLSIILESLLHISSNLDETFLQKLSEIILEFCSNEILALQIFNLIICNLKKRKNFEQIHSFLSNNLCSPNKELRKLTSHTLNYFNKLENLNGIYEIFYKIDLIEPTVHSYREQTLLIEKFSPDGEYFKSLKSNEIKLDCLKFLLGLLYCNFKLMWEPILKQIESFSHAFKLPDFWDIYKVKLEETVAIINNNEQPEDSKFQFQNEVFAGLSDIYMIGKIDYTNYRNLLWSKLQNFGQLSEVKNRELITLFLNFVNDEYRKSHKSKVLTWNISDELQEDADDDDDHDEDEEIEVQEDKPLETQIFKKKHQRVKKEDYSIKNPVHTLCIKMRIFTKQSNPKQLHREPELYELYLELLTGINPVLQKLALECILAYKNKSVSPYRDNLYGMIDENQFRNELINFKIESIPEENRKYLMEILLRILYGKMMTKSSAKQSLSNQARKSIVLRFLGSCQKFEILQFLKMVFSNYGDFLNEALSEIQEKIDKVFSLKEVWSAKKMQSSLNLLELIRKQFAGLMDDDFLEYMLKLIAFIGHVCNRVLENSDKILLSKIPIVYKNVKTVALTSLVNFFEHFEQFNWQWDHIKVMTEIFVWPNLEKLPSDSIHSPTPLMKLLCTWSYQPKHFDYLIQEKNGLIPFEFIIKLLLNEKAKAVVRKQIMEMIERLLMAETESSSNPGIKVIKPYLSDILKRLKMNFSQKGAKRNLEKRDLNILAMLTELVEDSETCDSLLQLLLPILISKSQNSTEDVVEKIIKTLSNLMKKLERPELYVRKIAPLFELVNEVTARKMLCNLLSDIETKSQSKLLETGKIIKNLNAWDKRWIEQPDYDKRLNALRNITENLNHVDMNLGILVIYNCFYFLKYDKDMGMRDNAAEHLKILVPSLVRNHSRNDVEFLIGDVLLNLVRRTLRDKNESFRNEGILLLGVLASQCSKSHQILSDLSKLVDNLDKEVDFFENITHLQSYRHGRALLKFCAVAKNLEAAPNYKTLTQFILPLATRYLLSEKFIGKHTLIDAAIETIGVVCQLLPWHHYQTILKFYLQKMRYNNEYQKQCVRIVIAILDSFHFDLSSAGGASAIELRNQNESKKQKDHTTVREEEVTQDDEDQKLEIRDEDLDSELDDIKNDFGDETSEPQNKKQKLDSAFMHSTVLEASAAKKIIHTISTILIPTLNHSITEKSSYDAKHKLNRKRFSVEREEEEILRVPIALALVKLLQKLPKQVLNSSLPGVFMKVCTFLKSPLKSVRMLTRDILKKIMQTLGSSYLSILIEQLTTLLTRGFQVHVLSVTIHGVLDCLKEKFQPRDLESCLKNILEVSLNDIFGEISIEKEIHKIASHTPEAKPSSKSYLTLHIAARNITESCLLDLLMPFKDLLAKSQSSKTVQKIQECFQKIVTGLVENSNISLENLLIFIYGTMSESIIDLLPGNGEKPQLTEKEKEKMRRVRPDCFLIPEAPRSRSGALRKTVKTNIQANAHVLIEFGLEMFQILLKRKKIIEIVYQPFLNPLLPLLKDSLKSSHIRVTTFALKGFIAIWNSKYQLELALILQEVIDEIFKILHKYASFGASKKDDNFHLVKSAFKAMVAVLRNCEEYTVESEHINQLLFYIEQDIFESDKQPMAFSLLKAIVQRKVQMPEIHEIMKKVLEITIQSQSDYAREECRSILIFYVMEYPLAKKIDSILKFFTTQLSYEVTTGRLSSIKFLQMIIKKFPLDVLSKKSEFLFLSFGTRLVNEEVPECRIAVAECIELLLSRLDKDCRKKLFDITLTLLENGEKPAIREMAATLCSRFVSQEKQTFTDRVKICFPILVNRLTMSNPKAPGRFVKATGMNQNEESEEETEFLDETIRELQHQEKQRAIDHELIQIQNCILKILEFCFQILVNNDFNSLIDELAYETQKLLGYEHEWVRLNSAKILSQIIGNLNFDLIGDLLLKKVELQENQKDFFHMNPEGDIRNLVLDLCAQLQPGETHENMTDEVVKILLFIANILKVVPVKQEDEGEAIKLNLNWLIRRIRYVIHGEISKAPHVCVLRSSIFNWIEGLITLIDIQMMENLALTILPPLIREMSEEDQNIDPKLRQQAIRIGNRIRKCIGSDNYDKLRSSIQMKLMMRRAERKKQLAMEKINDPVRAAKRRQGVQDRKKIAKKRKMDVIKGKIQGKKKRKLKPDEEVY